MVREVRHDATGPLKVDENDFDDEKGNIAICLCGLSEEYPLCDGSHRATRDEETDTVYRYENGDRRIIEEIVYRDGRSDGDSVDGGDNDE
jgi:CDGSH iron-sulfur domain-containing protein 1